MNGMKRGGDMKHNKKRITKIIDELTMYLFAAGATDISVNIQDRDEDYRLCIKSNFDTNKIDKIHHLVEVLKSSKQEEIEEYYWELAGESDVGCEIYLTAMMLNHVEITLTDQILELEILKNK